ncbi:putative cyclic AMP-dependent protein kinase catalytic subunit [Chiua virens]|nr:putative cyclic AMP-dependent protein kinase catalytic subunit [Chiua virens]
MDRFHAPTPQSVVPVTSGTAPYRRHQSVPMVYEVLMTPPVSPGNSEDGTDTGPSAAMIVHQGQSSCPEKPSNQEFQSQPHRPPPLQVTHPHWLHLEPPKPPTPPPQPARSLENEQVHVQKRGVLKLKDFEARGALGTGTFGRVLLVRLKSPTPGSQSYFAMKVLRKVEIVRLRQVEHVNAERYILSRVRHPFIVDLFATFQDSLNIYMLMSYIPGGELFTHLRRAQRFTPDVTRFYLANIILALKYLHSFNIIYRDLKPENLLLDSRGYLRLTDFGFAKIVDDRTWTLCGTPEYLAPEIIQSEGHGKAADWWACGILCYEMLVGYPPFFHETAYGIYEKILRGVINWPHNVDRLSKELIKAFLHPDRTKRLGNMIGGPQDVLDHPWFRGVDWDALERCEIKVISFPVVISDLQTAFAYHCYQAPIIPHTTSLDDTRHFLHLPLPSLEDMPGLVMEESPLSIPQQFDPTVFQFFEF